ncbi:MAG: ABC transporter ATP-binding protein [Pseudobdellovibrionaceae bacterium]
MQTAIEIKNVSKKYDDAFAINNLSLEIFKGECFGLLGPNGAGKSTTMKMMYGSAMMDTGELYVLGLNVRKNVAEIKKRIGIVPQDDGLDIEFSVFENLMVFSSYFNIPKEKAREKIKELLRWMRLEEYVDRSVESLSGGMKRRLTLARSLLNEPQILFLDEPTTGLDPQSRLWLWNFVKKMKADGSTLILTTHYMEEAESLCDRVAIIDHGKILALGSPKSLIQDHLGKEVIEFEAKAQDLNYYLQRLKQNKLDYQVIETNIFVHVAENQDVKDVLALISSDAIHIRKPKLNDVFLKLAGYQLRDER